ncbi:magnesium transporter NIPA-domain-containing protein [Colletotrichum navitas]|uniref:Magnesium transporter NIPA-domain-containing protein n=1 Tax=Colletotrichum navitas TaxID=681940 RepID=A0AAD8VB75_9PEZI|nr:magnesium transporter NIPA-domain-containing protein [Colletotrichum navitas]KAK1598758.1 magnesium transporter NIPA-domain-containing protein [Colletotrichum navitas]
MTIAPVLVAAEPAARPDDDKDLQNWSSLIGIITAIVGNVLIALALNVQRYAHLRLHRERIRVRRRAREALKHAPGGVQTGPYGTVGGGEAGDTDARRDGVNHHAGDDGDDSAPLTRSFRSEESAGSDYSGDDDKTPSTYLKSPYWWAGQILITLGELGNFLAYGFAPASIVSPLGVVALISNCVIAPILFKEKFRQRDFWGVIIAVAGVVVVVLSAKQEETKLDPGAVWDAITTLAFEIYLAVTISLIVVLMWASPRYGHRTILIDLGLVGLFGGFTALSTKGVSSILSTTLLGAFKTPVAWALLFILLFTAVMQVRYVNKALQRFSSTQVIPIQFVLFTLCVIVGSAVLYRDFERTSAEQAGKFIGGCLLTFFGVFLITNGRVEEDVEDGMSDTDGVEETIGLAEQDGYSPTQPLAPSSISVPSSRSRRSSRASNGGHLNNGSKQFSMQHDSGIPTLRVPAAATISDDSIHTFPGFGSPPSEPATPYYDGQLQPKYPTDTRPVTPRTSLPNRPHSHQYPGPIFSPSPLSSTVSAVVKDTLLRSAESPLLRRPSVRRLRSSIRASLFMSENSEGPDGDAERQDLMGGGIDYGDGGVAERSRTAGEGASRGPQTGRPRSLSDTLGGLFRSKRNRRDANTDPGENL